MSLQTTFTSRPLCQACSIWLVKSFWTTIRGDTAANSSTVLPTRRYNHRSATAIINGRQHAASGLQSHHGSTRRPVIVHGHSVLHQRRGISTADDFPLLEGDYISSKGTQHNPSRPEKAPEKVNDNLATASDPSPSYVPWYLEHKSDEVIPTQHTAEGQEMPEIPEYSPDLLEPVVKHVLETLGLTYLRVLDLRGMTDPPPALGANLLMVVATARSERHLHASADKLCRWLRTEYKLTPFADGLLGRNEMKIAIRRRTRRAKMMSAVGTKTVDSGDIADGLRSEWICVNVGRVEGGVLPKTEETEAQKEIVGFGTANTSSTVVVQMMTEDKRQEIDLEGLWSAALRRQQRKKQALLDGNEVDAADLDQLVVDDALTEHPKNANVYQPSFESTRSPAQMSPW